jgi:hypothetical protein
MEVEDSELEERILNEGKTFCIRFHVIEIF